MLCFSNQKACSFIGTLFVMSIPDTKSWLSQDALHAYLLKMLVKIRAPFLAKPKVTAGFTLRFCWSLILPAGSRLRCYAFLPDHPSKQLPGLSVWHWSWFFWLLAFLDLTVVRTPVLTHVNTLIPTDRPFLGLVCARSQGETRLRRQ